MGNPYDVERSWPPYFLEHRKLFEEGMQGTYQCGDLPIYTVHAPLGHIGNAIFIVGDDGVLLYDTGIGESPARSSQRRSARSPTSRSWPSSTRITTPTTTTAPAPS